MERAFFAPGFRFASERTQRFGSRSLVVVEPSAAEMGTLTAGLRFASPSAGGEVRARALALSRAASRFVDPADPLRRRALESLPALTGFSPKMIENALASIFAPLDERSIEAVAGAGASRAVALVGIVSAGNIPGVALPQAVLALAAGSSCLVKMASGEPLLMALVAEALHAIDAELGAKLAVLWWRGGEAACERALAEEVDSLVVYGSDAAVAAWSAHAPRRLVPHGHRASIAVVRPSGADDELRSLAAAAATDVAMYDQLGCLSPQCVFVIGGGAERRNAFAERLGEALEAEERRMPRGLVPEPDEIAIRRLRDEYEWREIRGEPVTLLPRADVARWTIVADETPEFRPSPLYRTVVLRTLAHAGDLAAALRAWLPRIESAGIGPWPDPELLEGLAAVPRLVPLGSLQIPDLAWRQGGLDPMAAIIDGGSV